MGVNFINPLEDPKNDNKLKYDNKSIEFKNLNSILSGNRLFAREGIDWYNKFSRYGYVDPYNTDQVVREFLFFTKPDLSIFASNVSIDANGKITETLQSNGHSYDSKLRGYLQQIPFFSDAYIRNRDALRQLQYTVKDKNEKINPFMYLLSNSVTSKLDLPGISAEARESTSTIMGTNIQYRGHSYKSDNGYDFSLSFHDTSKLEVYTLLKAYDEYMRLIKTGEIAPRKDYIINKIVPEQFSIYKFLIGSDGETILYYAKLTGCFFTDVPRGDFSDPGPDGFKFSASFHAQFVEDSNPMILEEFNRISPGKVGAKYADTYDYTNNVVDNSWVKWPVIIKSYNTYDNKVSIESRRKSDYYDYKMKWVK